MTNIFKTAAQRITRSPFVIVISLVFFVLFIISLGLLWESYQTTVLGYSMLPTAKVNPWIIPLVGLLPIVGEIAFTYTFAVDTRKRWAVFVAFLLHLFDIGTDVFYKAHGREWYVWIIALFESEILFTLGAVAGFTFSLGMLIELLPHALEQMGNVFRASTGALGLHDEDEDGPALRRGMAGHDLD